MVDFSLSRSVRVQVAPERVHFLLEDFREWQRWSPWEGLDPAMRREYSGPARGVGSSYHWSGNKRAGEGEMRMTESTVSRVTVDLDFLKPFKASNVTTFDLVPSGEGTEVIWTMTGTRSAVMSLMGRLVFDRAIAGDFDKGLASLKREAERP